MILPHKTEPGLSALSDRAGPRDRRDWTPRGYRRWVDRFLTPDSGPRPDAHRQLPLRSAAPGDEFALPRRRRVRSLPVALMGFDLRMSSS